MPCFSDTLEQRLGPQATLPQWFKRVCLLYENNHPWGSIYKDYCCSVICGILRYFPLEKNPLVWPTLREGITIGHKEKGEQTIRTFLKDVSHSSNTLKSPPRKQNRTKQLSASGWVNRVWHTWKVIKITSMDGLQALCKRKMHLFLLCYMWVKTNL